MVRSFQLSLINTGVRNRPLDSLAVDAGPIRLFTNSAMSCASQTTTAGHVRRRHSLSASAAWCVTVSARQLAQRRHRERERGSVQPLSNHAGDVVPTSCMHARPPHLWAEVASRMVKNEWRVRRGRLRAPMRLSHVHRQCQATVRQCVISNATQQIHHARRKVCEKVCAASIVGYDTGMMEHRALY